MLTRKLSKLRSKITFSVSSQDKNNPYPRTDTSQSENSEFEAVLKTSNSDLLSHSMENEHGQLDSGVAHAELWFPTEPIANMTMQPIDISYAESQTLDTKVSLELSSVAQEDINIGPPVLPPYDHAEEQFLEDYEDYFQNLSVDNIRKEQYPKLDLQRIVYLDYANFALFSRFQVYGSSNSMYRGSIISFNVMDSTGNILPASLIQRLAERNNIVVGAGNFCNPGLAHVLSKSQERIYGSSMFDKEYDFSSVRVSLGPVSTFKDIYRLAEFLCCFRDEDYIEAQAIGFIEESMP